MSKMAGDYNAINLSQGFPNFPTDEILIESIKQNAGANIHQYSPMAGLPSLLEGISNLVHKFYKRDLNPTENILFFSIFECETRRDETRRFVLVGNVHWGFLKYVPAAK
jgi:aspartate/methionine/tyrosine aminotransferase